MKVAPLIGPVAVVLLLAMAPNANAGPVTLDFDGPDVAQLDCIVNSSTEGVGCLGTYFEDGFQIEVLSGHADFLDGRMGFDGGPFPWLRLSLVGGGLFNLLSVDVFEGNKWHQISSNGGFFNLHSIFAFEGTLNFTGSDWRQLEWVDFADDAATSYPHFFDNIRLVRVPAPGSLSLLVGGLLALGLMRRKVAA